MKLGDTFRIENDYKRRTFWQWLTRQPRELQTWQIVGVYSSGNEPSDEHFPLVSGVIGGTFNE